MKRVDSLEAAHQSVETCQDCLVASVMHAMKIVSESALARIGQLCRREFSQIEALERSCWTCVWAKLSQVTDWSIGTHPNLRVYDLA